MSLPYTMIAIWTDTRGEDTIQTLAEHIYGPTAHEAVANYMNSVDNPDNLQVVAVFEGHLQDLYV